MAFSIRAHAHRHAPNTDINLVPLIDVMLVLVIIFMVTAPLMTQAVKLNLPKAQAQPHQTPAEAIALSIDAQGGLYWNQDAMAWNELADRLRPLATQNPQPAVHLRADETVPYKQLMRVMATVSQAGLSQLSFVTEPDTGR